jgi:hypothetical protein
LLARSTIPSTKHKAATTAAMEDIFSNNDDGGVGNTSVVETDGSAESRIPNNIIVVYNNTNNNNSTTTNNVVDVVGVGCQQQLSTPALVGMICGGAIISSAIIVLVWCSIFRYNRSTTLSRRKNVMIDDITEQQYGENVMRTDHDQTKEQAADTISDQDIEPEA